MIAERPARLLVGVGSVVLAVGTVVVFRWLDARSHSASDTLRPFVITVTPVWVAAVIAARALLRSAASH